MTTRWPRWDIDSHRGHFPFSERRSGDVRSISVERPTLSTSRPRRDEVHNDLPESGPAPGPTYARRRMFAADEEVAVIIDGCKRAHLQAAGLLA